MVLSSSYLRYSTKVVFTRFLFNLSYIKLNTPFLHTREINMLWRISCTYLNFQRGITAMPVALGSKIKCILCNPFTSMTSQKILPVTFQIDAKKLTWFKHHADPHNPQPTEPSIFFHKRGTLFFADQPPDRMRVESKGAACIPRHPITLSFVGYPTFLVGRAGEAQRQSRRNAVGAKAGWAGGLIPWPNCDGRT